jgi:molybdopterin-biosynthesis enzyme MoeA-like protein
MAIGALIIGDEIMRGKKQDRHFPKLVELLAARGMHLSWAEYLGDEPPRIVDALTRGFATGDLVFSFGGIGATPDDHTRRCVANALGVELVLHPEAEVLIHTAMQKRAGMQATARQLEMGAFPAGAQIIPNTFNGIPGFSIQDHHFLPGFPEMAWSMAEWVLDNRYAHLHHTMLEGESAIYVYDAMESTLTPLMEEIEHLYPGLKVFSLPHVGTGGVRRHVELGVRGEPTQIEPAMEAMKAGVVALNGDFSLDRPTKKPA